MHDEANKNVMVETTSTSTGTNTVLVSHLFAIQYK